LEKPTVGAIVEDRYSYKEPGDNREMPFHWVDDITSSGTECHDDGRLAVCSSSRRAAGRARSPPRSPRATRASRTTRARPSSSDRPACRSGSTRTRSSSAAEPARPSPRRSARRGGSFSFERPRRRAAAGRLEGRRPRRACCPTLRRPPA
jgi:hypothetical protein